MTTPKKGLQKFTKTELKVNRLLSKKQITNEDLKVFNKREIGKLNEVINQRFRSLKGDEKEAFIKKLDLITNNTMKNELWEYNHNKITYTISIFIRDNGRMPSKSEIADGTGLSRQTIHKHMKDFASNNFYKDYIEQYKFLTSKLLAKVFQFAMNGDLKAAKVYLGFMLESNTGQHSTNDNNTLIQTQNNFIQINGKVISQETIQHLNPEQVMRIENILNSGITIEKGL